jgi:hypothetical protein
MHITRGNAMSRMRVLLALWCFVSAHALAAAGPTLEVQLPEGSRAQSATARASQLKLDTRGTTDGRTVRFANLLPDTRYDVQITLADGTVLQGVDMSWYSDEPPRPDAPPLDDDDRQAIKELFSGIQAFENKRNMLLMSGNHDRVTILAELIRDTPFYGNKGTEVIWRAELWYFKNQHGGWEKVPQTNKVLLRERISRNEFERRRENLKWLGELGGLRLGKDETKKVVSVSLDRNEEKAPGAAGEK